MNFQKQGDPMGLSVLELLIGEEKKMEWLRFLHRKKLGLEHESLESFLSRLLNGD